MKKITLLSIWCSLFLLLSYGTKIYAQVTIGTGEVPVAGALLQVKNIENIGGGLQNADKGVALPRVNLTDVNMLYPMFKVGYKKEDIDAAHTGLIVFNTNATLPDSYGMGLYVWNGKSWRAMTGLEDSNTIEINPTQLYLSELNTTAKATLTTGRSGQLLNMTSTGIDDSSTMKSVQNGKKSILTFNRSKTTSGNKIYTFKLADKPTVQAQLEVSNLELKINKPILRVGMGSVNGVVNSSTAIEPIGGDAKWELVDYTKTTFTWSKPPKNDNGRLTFELGATQATGNVRGSITVRHLNEPNLIKTIIVEQNKNYLVLP